MHGEKQPYKEIGDVGEMDLADLELRVAGVDSATKGAAFEKWTAQHIFGEKNRVTIPADRNHHLAQVDDSGLGMAKNRVIADHYGAEDGSIWDMKMYDGQSQVDWEQLNDYSLMADAGYVYDSQGNRLEVNSINYLFSNRASAEANAWRLWGHANAWYVDEQGGVQLLKS